VLVIPLFALESPELSLQLMDGHIDTPVRILPCFGPYKNLAVLGSGNNLHACTAPLAPIDNHFNLIDTVVVPRQLGGLFLGVLFHRIRYFNMFAADCKKQNDSP
jgi:hypothetical protein